MWWFPCQNHRIHTVDLCFWPLLHNYADPPALKLSAADKAPPPLLGTNVYPVVLQTFQLYFNISGYCFGSTQQIENADPTHSHCSRWRRRPPPSLLCLRFCDVRCNIVHPALRTHPQALQQTETQTPPAAAVQAFL